MNIEYERLEWEDYPSIETPLSAENLNHLEEGIAALYSERYELQSNIAYVEDGEAASKEYLPNSYLMKDGLFYKVTKPIYYGDTFDSGEDGNITHVDISSQFGSGGGGSTGCVELTLAQYNALSEESKMADVIYLITDSPDNYLDEVFGDFATVEPTNTASKPYEAGDYLVYDNKFYLVTDDIAQGDTITPGTNVEQTTVGEEFTKLRVANKTSTSSNFTSQLVNFPLYSLRKTGNLVIFTGRIDLPTTAATATWHEVGTLPSGYRPADKVLFSGCDAWNQMFLMEIYTTGSMRLWLDGGSYSSGYLNFNMSWFTA